MDCLSALHLILIRYDGGNIGDFIPDAIQRIQGQFQLHGNSDGVSEGFSNASGVFTSGGSYPMKNVLYNGYSDEQDIRIYFDSSLAVRSAADTHPAGISFLPCISY